MNKEKTSGTLCWTCENAFGGCSWSEHGVRQPVDGWTATPTKNGFFVIDCPQYRQEENRMIKGVKKALGEKGQYIAWTPELISKVEQMVDGGMTYAEIAKEINCTSKAIQKMRARQRAKGLLPPAKGESEKDLEVPKPKTAPAQEEYSEDKSWEELYEEMVYNGFMLACSQCLERSLPIAKCWRVVLNNFEEALSEFVDYAKEHPNAATHLAAAVAIITADEIELAIKSGYRL